MTPLCFQLSSYNQPCQPSLLYVSIRPSVCDYLPHWRREKSAEVDSGWSKVVWRISGRAKIPNVIASGFFYKRGGKKFFQMLEKNICSCKCNWSAVFKEGWKVKSGSKDETDESDVPVSSHWGWFQMPHSSEQLSSDKSTPVWLQTLKRKQKVNGRREGGRWAGRRWLKVGGRDIFLFSLLWRVHTKGSLWSPECWAHTCGMKSKPSVNYIKYPPAKRSTYFHVFLPALKGSIRPRSKKNT